MLAEASAGAANLSSQPRAFLSTEATFVKRVAVSRSCAPAFTLRPRRDQPSMCAFSPWWTIKRWRTFFATFSRHLASFSRRPNCMLGKRLRGFKVGEVWLPALADAQARCPLPCFVFMSHTSVTIYKWSFHPTFPTIYREIFHSCHIFSQACLRA